MARELIPVTLFNGQAVFAQKLFEPDTKDMSGKLLDKPSYSIIVRFPKTKPTWYEEPLLKPLVDACKVIMQREMADTPFSRIEFPVTDGDIPNTKNKVPEWAKGHWTIRAKTTFDNFKVKQVVNGVETELPALTMGGKRLWGDGDHVAVSLSIAKRMTDMVGILAYLQGVMFTKKGVQLATGGSPDVSLDEMREAAKAQGIEIMMDAAGSGFAGAGGGFPGGATAEAAGGFNPGANADAGGGFNPGGNAGGFNPGAAAADKPPF